MENKEVKPAEQTVTAAAGNQVAEAKTSKPDNNNHSHFDRPFNRDSRGGNRRFSHRTPVKKEYEERVVHISKVSKTVKGGRKMRFSAVVVIGNGKGRFGFGIGKSIEVPEAIKKAISVANSDIINLPIVKNDTIPHTVEGNFGACKVFLKPAPAGTGIVAGGSVRAILELAGIKNVYSKVYGSRSTINVIKATVDGIKQLKTVSLAKQSLAQENGSAKEAI